MGTKSKTLRLESEIEKCRGEANWSKVGDIAKQLSTKNTDSQNLVKFVLLESNLERLLLDVPPPTDICSTNSNEKYLHKSQISRAKIDELTKIKDEFTGLLNSDPKPEIKVDSKMLLIKVYFMLENYTFCLELINQIDLSSILPSSKDIRRLKIMAEIYSIKGLCMENASQSLLKSLSLKEKESIILDCFEQSGDISILHLQEQNIHTPTSLGNNLPWNVDTSDISTLGPLGEIAIQRSPILYIRNGQLARGIQRFRELLQAVETRAVQSLRQMLSRQLAEVLLRGVCSKTYPQISAESIKKASSNKTYEANKRLRPHEYKGSQQFVPSNISEEILLLLSISESIAVKAAVLNRSPECDESRQHTFHNTSAVYDLLTIALTKNARFPLLSDTFERAMKFSYEQFHIWYQFGLSLINADKPQKALLVLNECMRLQPNNIGVYLQAAKICYEKLGKIEEGIKYCEKVIELSKNNFLLAKGYLSLGIGHRLMSEVSRLQNVRQSHQKKALSFLNKAHILDKNDHLSLFHTASQLATMRHISEATKYVRHSLRIKPDYVHSLHLLILLLATQNHLSEAMSVTSATIHDYPNHFPLLLLHCKLVEMLNGPEKALHVCRSLLNRWKELYEASLSEQGSMSHQINARSSDLRSSAPTSLTPGDLDSGGGSTHGDSRYGLISENGGIESVDGLSSWCMKVVRSNGSIGNEHGALALQVRIWLRMAELYLLLSRKDEVAECIREATEIAPLSPYIAIMRGRLAELNDDLVSARTAFEDAFAIQPTNVEALWRLGSVLYQLGLLRRAEYFLRDAVNINPTESQSWLQLGKVLHELEDYEAASDCTIIATDLEGTNPPEPFFSIVYPFI